MNSVMLSLNVIQFVLTELSLVSLSLVSWTSNHSIDLFLSLPFAYTPRIPSKTALGQSSRLIGFFTAPCVDICFTPDHVACLNGVD